MLGEKAVRFRAAPISSAMEWKMLLKISSSTGSRMGSSVIANPSKNQKRTTEARSHGEEQKTGTGYLVLGSRYLAVGIRADRGIAESGKTCDFSETNHPGTNYQLPTTQLPTTEYQL